MDILIEILIYLFFTFGIISFCEKLYIAFFNFNIKKYKKENSGEIKLILKIDKYENYIDEVLRGIVYGDYENIQYITDKVEIVAPKSDLEKIKNSIWYSTNFKLIVKK